METDQARPEAVSREVERLLDEWTVDPQNARTHFQALHRHLASRPGVTFTFNSRPGVSHSLRAQLDGCSRWPLFAMVDVIDDDPENRWLSVCFFGEMITDPEEHGDLVPGGLLGRDGHCFDLDEDDPQLAAYIRARVDEAYAFVGQNATG